MPSLLLVILVLQILIHSVNSIDGAVLGEILWIWYNKLPTPTSTTVQKIGSHRKELLRLKRELANVSAQDNFAKWAKLQRQHDKETAEYEKAASSINSAKSTFVSVIKACRFLGTNALRFILQMWHSTEPMFWLPAGALPWYIEWILSFPKAPMGSVSVQAWWMACVSVVMLAQEGGAAVWRLTRGDLSDSAKAKEKPMAFESKSETQKATPNGKASKVKKEL